MMQRTYKAIGQLGRIFNHQCKVQNKLSCGCVHQTYARRRQLCTAAVAEPIPPPHVEGTDKEYDPKIKQIVTDISKLTLIEVADLNELLKKTLNISDAPMMAMGAMPAGPAKAEEEEAEVKQEKSAFSVNLIKFEEPKKVAVIKLLKSVVEGMNLVQAKKFVESVPQTVKADLPKDEAEELKKKLEEAGATVELA